MENIQPVTAQESSHKRRRRSHRKSRKTTYQQRLRMKNIGFWLVTALIGGLVVTGIAIMAGGSSN